MQNSKLKKQSLIMIVAIFIVVMGFTSVQTYAAQTLEGGIGTESLSTCPHLRMGYIPTGSIRVEKSHYVYVVVDSIHYGATCKYLCDRYGYSYVCVDCPYFIRELSYYVEVEVSGSHDVAHSN